ncbi:MAG: cation transporter, partial [Lachnospiraceae bacterium]|nr:cation transporter [Lachnospiraceae bacterium]
SDVLRTVAAFEGVIQAHGYFCDEKKKYINLDVIIDYNIKERGKLITEIREKLGESFPDYKFNVVQDIDI